MYSCRMCCENPFRAFFGQPQVLQEKESGSSKGGKTEAAKRRTKKAAPKKCVRDEASFQPRSEEEVQETIKQWQEYAHPRAREFFTDPELMAKVLAELARGTDKRDDCVLGPEDKCVFWYGNITNDDCQAAIKMVKPGEDAESVTYVNRVLAFLFATDESFEKLMKLPKQPFKMSCDDQLCVHLAHILLSV
mmetsp:Transcript_31318/g.97432  ORF Transcript_31318/g.97432 Transcript_31318/m.97432 type:complete len:191 (+) Transcript_31318:75-647(+)